jgi:Na+-driven multidrug efflux pump
VFIRVGLGITGVAIGTTIAFIIHSLLLTGFGIFVQKKFERGELFNSNKSSQCLLTD